MEQICQLSTVFALRPTGACGTYVNPHGAVHRTLTVRSVLPHSLELDGRYSTESSWFPGQCRLVYFVASQMELYALLSLLLLGTLRALRAFCSLCLISCAT